MAYFHNEEQARIGYSLAQQLKALREHTAREDLEVAEEVSDQRQSGAFTAAPDVYLRNGSRCYGHRTHISGLAFFATMVGGAKEVRFERVE